MKFRPTLIETARASRQKCNRQTNFLLAFPLKRIKTGCCKIPLQKSMYKSWSPRKAEIASLEGRFSLPVLNFLCGLPLRFHFETVPSLSVHLRETRSGLPSSRTGPSGISSGACRDSSRLADKMPVPCQYGNPPFTGSTCPVTKEEASLTR